MMDKKILRFCFCTLIAIFVLPSVIIAASFDCSKASSKTEKVICNDPMLSKLDDDLAAAYSKALKLSDRDIVKEEQRKWLKEKLAPCHENKECIKKTYENRLHQLSYANESTNGAQTTYDYKLFKPLKFKDFSVCGSISKNGLNKLYELELISSDISFVGEGGNVVLTNCNVYVKARQLGASPKTNYDLGLNNYYNFTCSTLNALKFSKKALDSFVDHKMPDINQLPVAIFVPPTDEKGNKLLDDSQKGVTVADYCRDNKMQCNKSDEIITIEDSEGVTQFELVSVGDFDRDGLDDILLYFLDYGKKSTWINYGFILLSKNTKNQKLYNMRNIYGGCVIEKNKYTCSNKYEWQPKK